VSEYLHQEPGTEVRFIAGQYTIAEERRMVYRGRELLYVVGIAEIDGSCCGTQGCRFVNVPGYIVAWKHRISENGLPASSVEPIEVKAEQDEIREILGRRYAHSQFHFPA
jgi:hypothetical protein